MSTLPQQDSCSTPQNYPVSQPSFSPAHAISVALLGLVIPVTPLANDLNTNQIFLLVPGISLPTHTLSFSIPQSV